MSNQFTIEVEQEEDGRWIADVQEIPGVLVYGLTKKAAVAKVEALALRVVADQLDFDGAKRQQLTSIAFSLA